MNIAKISVAPGVLAAAVMLIVATSTANADVTFSCKNNTQGVCNIVALPGCTSCAPS